MAKEKSPAHHETIIYGTHPVIETVIAARRKVEEFFISKEPIPVLKALFNDLSVHVTKLDHARMKALTRSEHHQGIAARVGPFPFWYIDDFIHLVDKGDHVVVILDELQDPVNLGNIIRISECLGASGILITKDRAVSVTPVVEKASSGASAHLPIVRTVNLVRAIEQMKDAGYWIFAAEAGAPEPFYETSLTGRTAFVMGSEGHGIRRLVRSKCDHVVSIPMLGRIESLNVSQATAVLLSEALRQRVMNLKEQ